VDTITPLKQRYYHGCLVTSLLMLTKMTDQSIEERIFFEGEKRDYDLYLNSTLVSFVDNTKLTIEVIADNKYFANELTSTLKRYRKSIVVSQQKVSAKLIAKLLETSAVILHIDENSLGAYSHSSHYVVVEKNLPSGNFQIFDPMTGRGKVLTPEKLDTAILSLKNHLKMCPVVIRKT